MLKTISSHVRDNAIWFDEEPHKYYINGVCDNISATTLIHTYAEKFDSDKIIKFMMKSKKWPENKYYGMTPDEIKKLWSDNGAEAAKEGTKMHKSIENFWNGLPPENESKEYEMFLKFKDDHPNLVAYRTEWEVYQEDYGICGSIDMIFINEDDSLSLYDWKRCKDIDKVNRYGKKCLYPVNHLPDTNYWHYSLQLNLYKFIIESKYDKVVKDMHILCLHPNKDEYQKFEIQDFQKEIQNLLKHYVENKK